VKFIHTPIHGAYVITLEEKRDNRGFFARVFDLNEFSTNNLETQFVQANLSATNKKGTIRGLHYQFFPHEEAKLIRCIAGRIYDVIVDMREDSPSYHQWFGIELTSENNKMMYIPKKCANGYQALEGNSKALYWVTEFYAPDFEKGVRYNDPTIGIVWPITKNIVVSKKDKKIPGIR